MSYQAKQIGLRTSWIVGAILVVAGLNTPISAQGRFGNAPPNLGSPQGAAPNAGFRGNPTMNPAGTGAAVGTGRPSFGPNVGTGAQAGAQPPSFTPPGTDGSAANFEPVEPRSGWKFPNLNPFRSRDPERPMAGLSDEPPSKGWKMPSLPKPSLPSLTRNDSPRPPRTEREFKPLQRINSGARGFFSTARNTITRPFQRSEAPAANAAPEESRWRLFNRQPEEPPQSVESANDWLKLPRPSAGN